jgi:hypothetical protein
VVSLRKRINDGTDTFFFSMSARGKVTQHYQTLLLPATVYFPFLEDHSLADDWIKLNHRHLFR